MTLSTIGTQVFKHKLLLMVTVMAALLLGSLGTAYGTTTVIFSDFTSANAGALQINGDAAIVDPVLRLTPNVQNKAGSVFLKNAISLADDASFSTAFEFQISNPVGGGADGFVFVVQ